ncbi:MAG: response regulator [Deltaproteobacteria bacterium]|nr:response regulator [Deltaproteobacteria bacterium]
MMRVLAADDELSSRIILEDTLKSMGHDVILCKDGEEAWEVMQQSNPPLLLVLDWMMPGLSGLDLCRRIREAESDVMSYIIMLTSLSNKEHIVNALEAGANDFVTKPFHMDEFSARLSVARRMLDAEAVLVNKNKRLEEIIEERAQLLLHADKMATLGTLSAGIAHEINNPATFIAGNISVLEQIMDIVKSSAETNDGSMNEQLSFALEQFQEIVAGIRKGVSRIKNITSGLKTYAYKGSVDRFGAVDFESCIDEALKLCENRLKYNIEVIRETRGEHITVWGDEQKIVQVIVNLIVNGADAIEDVEQAQLRISTEYDRENVHVYVSDNGKGISEDNIERIFDPFVTTKDVGKGTGLGLSICGKIIESHGGKIEVSRSLEGGAQFHIELKGYNALVDDKDAASPNGVH